MQVNSGGQKSFAVQRMSNVKTSLVETIDFLFNKYRRNYITTTLLCKTNTHIKYFNKERHSKTHRFYQCHPFRKKIFYCYFVDEFFGLLIRYVFISLIAIMKYKLRFDMLANHVLFYDHFIIVH